MAETEPESGGTEPWWNRTVMEPNRQCINRTGKWKNRTVKEPNCNGTDMAETEPAETEPGTGGTEPLEGSEK